jgi:predicted ribosome quality control (RQC) complex YloA/Tae2 family protein
LTYLSGAIVQKVERLAPECVLLSIREPGRTAFLLVMGGRTPAIGEIDRPSGKLAADAIVQRLRRLLEGARVVGVTADRLVVRRGDDRAALIATAGGVALAEGVDEPTEVVQQPVDARDAYARYLADAAARRRRAVLASIEAARKKLRRRLEAIEGDLAKIARADEHQAHGTLLITQQHLVQRGAASVTIDDWSTGEAVPVTIALDPSKNAKENADALFHRARRMKKGQAIADQRRAETEKQLRALDAIAATEDPTILEERARAAGIRVAPPDRRAREREPERSPFHTFRSGDREILVGRGAKDNDVLTTKIAKPHHLWLHAKGWTGAHVIVPLDKTESCPSEVLVDAAHLAAHFSDARGESVVEIQYTPRKYVRKPRGSAPGAVVVDREKVLVLRVEPERTARLTNTA